MDAMIFAAGLGSRLRPLTDSIPKALVPVGGVPMLERVARRLIDAGATRLVINAHHHADQIMRFVEEHDGFDVETFISDESDLLRDTGGGLLHAAHFFRRDEPFILHNGDVLTDIDLAAFARSHREPETLATLAVMRREGSRYLLFDATGGLVGYGNSATGEEHLAREPRRFTERWGFCGIHVISPRIFDRITETGVFSIIQLYMRLAGEGIQIMRYDITGSLWIDIGKPEELERAQTLVD